jgi:hypothetical protein
MANVSVTSGAMEYGRAGVRDKTENFYRFEPNTPSRHFFISITSSG